MGRIDLHLHSTFSDGSLSPTDVITLGHTAGLRALAVTDHDTIDGLSEALEVGARLGIEVIPGIEISARFEGREAHILGYFIDWTDATLLERLEQQRASRHHRNPLVVEKLNQLGLDLTYEEVIATAGSDSVGRPHIAQALVHKGHVRSVQEAFDRYLKDGGSAYVPRVLPDACEVIRWIREASGVPVLAHPQWVKPQHLPLATVCRSLKDAGLVGIEVFYSTHTKRQISEFLEISRTLDLLITGGSDFHGSAKPDIRIGYGRGDLKVPEKLLEPLRQAIPQTA
ncbi:MAG: PHP domain-containing protein [Nitrospirota bacterium]|nr:PHP domain-containing protein [Nitrospirota bacterium]